MEPIPGTLAADEVTTVTLDGHYDTVTVRAAGTGTIWFTVDGEDPELNAPHLPRVAQGQTTVEVDSEDDPTVVKLISPDATDYQIWAGPALAAQSGASVAALFVRLRLGVPTGYSPSCDLLVSDPAGVDLFLDAALAGGPFTVGAGGHFDMRAFVPVLPDGCVLLSDSGSGSLLVSNAAGTEKISVETEEVALLSETTPFLTLDGAAIDEQIGSDLAVVDGKVVSTAGGQFFATAVFQVVANPS
jgi:hypothetical protein